MPRSKEERGLPGRLCLQWVTLAACTGGSVAAALLIVHGASDRGLKGGGRRRNGHALHG